MKNEKTLSGLAYMFLGAALLVSGARLQEQVDRLAADPELQLAKAMYKSLVNRTAEAKNQFLAGDTSAIPVQFEHATVPVVAPAVVTGMNVAAVSRVEAIEVVAPELPKVEVEIAELPKFLAPAPPSRMKIQILRARGRMAAMQSLPKHFEFTHFAPPAPGSEMQRVMVLDSVTSKLSSCESSADAIEVKTEL